jgi:hypothetical protein
LKFQKKAKKITVQVVLICPTFDLAVLQIIDYKPTILLYRLRSQ